jgi:hypothetical protein
MTLGVRFFNRVRIWRIGGHLGAQPKPFAAFELRCFGDGLRHAVVSEEAHYAAPFKL